MSVIADYTPADFEALNVTPEDYKLTVENKQWLTPHRPRVERCLEAMLYGTTDLMGIDRITMPSEYVATLVATLVGPCNRRAACHWLSTRKLAGVAANELAASQQNGGYDPTTPTQLWAQVVSLAEVEGSTEARQRFEQRIDRRVAEAAGIVVGRQTEKVK